MMDAILALDSAALLWVQEVLRTPFLNGFFSFFTHLGDWGFLWIAVSALMLCWKKTRTAGALGLCAIALGALCTNVFLKHLVARTRPFVTLNELTALVVERDPNSFPSGHTCAAFAAAWAWFQTLPWRWAEVTGLILAALMGLSRLYVGVHYPTDVLTGMLIGLLCAVAVVACHKKAVEHREGERL